MTHVNDDLLIRFTCAPEEEKSSIEIYSWYDQFLKIISHFLLNKNFTLPVGSLVSVIYFAKIVFNDSFVNTQGIVKFWNQHYLILY